MLEGCSASGEAGNSAASSVRNKSSDKNEGFDTPLALLNAQEYKAEAGDDDEETELEILAAVEEPVPRPDSLGDGHGHGFKGDDEEEDAAETHGRARGSKQCAEASSYGDGDLDHAVSPV